MLLWGQPPPAVRRAKLDRVLYAKTFSPLLLAYTLSRIEVVRSALLEEALEFTVLSSSSTSCTDWEAAFASLVCAGEAEFFRSPRTAAKADWDVDRSPELSALPSVDRSLVS
jgi:hypothetical protein